jgi:HSP20 family protein
VAAGGAQEGETEKGHFEFRYGRFYRAASMPAGTRADTLTAAYADGVLEISALVGEHASVVKVIPIAVAKTQHR